MSYTIDRVEEFHLNKPFQLTAPEYKEKYGSVEFEAFRAKYENLWIEEGPQAMEGVTISVRIIELTDTIARHLNERGEIDTFSRIE